MHCDLIAIPDADGPQAVEPVFQHLLQTYASETNKTVGVWRAVPGGLLDFRPREKTNAIRTILAHELLSERRFSQFVGTEELPVCERQAGRNGPRLSPFSFGHSLALGLGRDDQGSRPWQQPATQSPASCARACRPSGGAFRPPP
jgi:hypothetical protein